MESSHMDLTSPLLREAIGLLFAHQYALIAGDEDGADTLLSDLADCQYRLTWAQNEWLRGISGDLLPLSDEEAVERLRKSLRLPTGPTAGALSQQKAHAPE